MGIFSPFPFILTLQVLYCTVLFASAGKGGRGDLRACFVNSSNNSSRSLFFGMLPTKRRWLLKDMVTPILLPFRSSLSFSCKWEKREKRKKEFFSPLCLSGCGTVFILYFFRDRTWTEVVSYQRKSGHGYFPKLPTYVILSRQKKCGAGKGLVGRVWHRRLRKLGNTEAGRL